MTGFTKLSKPFLLAVAGGSGSGKTYFARDLARTLGDADCEIVFQDSFYIDQSRRFDHDGGAVNFDHPSSIDFPLLAAKLRDLKSGKPTQIPIYDFATHTRKAETHLVNPKPLIIVDGILILHVPAVRELFDDKIFFHTAEEIRFQRRLERDVRERGRTAEGVRNQFYAQVKPMHDEFVEPSRKHARLTVSTEEEYRRLLSEYQAKF